MTLNEVRERIQEFIGKVDFFNEHTPANEALFRQLSEGTYEAILTGNGKEMCLVPDEGTLHFLYRGQNQEHVPCYPSIYRNNPAPEEIFLNRMRLVLFQHLIHTHPVVEHFFIRHKFLLDEEGLAQHYGLNTSVLDLTSNLDIAIFFAVCKYDRFTDRYDYYRDNEEHEGILYVFKPELDNEPTPDITFNTYLRNNITPIGLQAFLRPAAQHGYALRISENESIKCWMYRFTFTSVDSKHYYDKYRRGEDLWIKDELIEKVKPIINRMHFSFKLFDETFEHYRPYNISKTKMKNKLKDMGVILNKDDEDIYFTKEERISIIEDWNKNRGFLLSTKIVRKPWYEHDGIDEETHKIKGKKNENNYRTLSLLGSSQMLSYIAEPNGPSGAKWVNYTNRPRKHHRKTFNTNIGWRKVPAVMMNVFGKTYLKKEDWWIDEIDS